MDPDQSNVAGAQKHASQQSNGGMAPKARKLTRRQRKAQAREKQSRDDDARSDRPAEDLSEDSDGRSLMVLCPDGTLRRR